MLRLHVPSCTQNFTGAAVEFDARLTIIKSNHTSVRPAHCSLSGILKQRDFVMKAKLLKAVEAFNSNINKDEDGMETLQAVMIVAIAAIVLIGVMTIGQDVYDWCVNNWLDLSESKIS